MKKFKETWQKSKRTIKNLGLVALVAGELVAGKARAQPSLSQLVYSHNGNIPDTAIIYKPDETDSLKTPIFEFFSDVYCWMDDCPASWNVQLTDSGKVKIKANNGDYSLIKWFANDPVVVSGLPGGFGINVKKVINADTADTHRISYYKKDSLDTLITNFKIRTGSALYDLCVDGSLLNPINGDSIIIEARAPGKSGFTQGEIKHRFIDADTFPSFSLTSLDLAINQILPDSAFKDSVINPKAIIQNHSVLKENPKVCLEIGDFYKDSLKKVLDASSIDTITFQPCSLGVPAGTYPIKAYLFYNYDINQANDTLKGSIYVRPNVGVEEIKQPQLNKFSNIIKGYIDLDEKTKGYLYDIVGRKVKKVKGKTDVRDLSSGVYFLFLEKNKVLSKPEKLIIFK